jgi:hypothetical protein
MGTTALISEPLCAGGSVGSGGDGVRRREKRVPQAGVPDRMRVTDGFGTCTTLAS